MRATAQATGDEQPLRARRGAPDIGGRRDQHQDEDRENVLEDQPPDGDMALAGFKQVVVRKDADQDHGARHGNGDAHDEARPRVHAERMRERRAQGPGDEDLADGAGDGDFPDGEEVAEVEMEAHAEHEQDDPDLGEVVRHLDVGDEARRVGAEGDPRDQVPDDRRKAEPLGRDAEHEREAQADGQVEEKNGCVLHRFSGRK